MSNLEHDIENFVRMVYLNEEIDKLKQALAEKDRELELADYTIKECLQKLSQQDKAYQQLMEQAVQFAEWISTQAPGSYIPSHSGSCGLPDSPCDGDCMVNAEISKRNTMIRKAKAFLKERA